SGALATFTDTQNPAGGQANVGNYTASVSWGNNSFVPATVTADPDPSDPNGYVISATSANPLSNPDALIVTEVQYASGSSYQGRPASLGEPVVSVTPALSNLAAVPVSLSQIDLSWTLNASNAISIEVDRADDGGAFVALPIAAGGSDTSYADRTVSEGHSYIYQIRAIQPTTGPSAYAGPVFATTQAVQGLVATAASSTEIDLSWRTLSSDPLATVDVQRAPFDLSSPFTTIATGLPTYANSYPDSTGLTAATHYVYQVVLHDSFGDTFTDPADTWTLPAAPSGLGVTAPTSGEVDLTWSNVSAGTDGIEIWRADSGGVYQLIDTLDPTATSYADTTVADGTQYAYRIVATLNGEESAVLQATG
ncbi:MAG: hypothetical protein JWN24_3525, partial [Phycisphaerales bacterium]|nr:hypothetical protein [Phycisphaerales bacterium]